MLTWKDSELIEISAEAQIVVKKWEEERVDKVAAWGHRGMGAQKRGGTERCWLLLQSSSPPLYSAMSQHA